MCYSAQVWADYRRYVRRFGARMDIKEFARLLRLRVEGVRISLPKGMTDPFKEIVPQDEFEQECRDLVLAYEAQLAPKLEADLFAQRRRLADAERKLAIKATKTASEEKRKAGNNIADLLTKLDDLRRSTREERDERIFAGYYCPALVMDGAGQYLVTPMRFLCRPAWMPSSFDKDFSGAYCARRDNLTKFWRPAFAQTRAVLMATGFYEHVLSRETASTIILRYMPEDGQPMPLACVWSPWSGRGEQDLQSFAIITDEPPPEVAVTGYDRCPIPLKEPNIGTWLARATTEADCQAVLDDRERPYYNHQLAA